MVSLFCDSSHEDSILLSTEFMRDHLREGTGYLSRLVMVVDKAIGCLGPFQDDIRTFFPMEREKTMIEDLAFLFEYTHIHLDTCLTEFPDTSTLYLSKLIDTTHHHTAHPLLDNQVGTGRRLTIV
jgi:hypothetical protein